jgi:uncharacterized protein (DUF927 family)
MPFTIDFEVPSNGRLHRATVRVLDGEGKVQFSDKADLMDAKERIKLANRIAGRLEVDSAGVVKKIETGWNDTLTREAEAKKQAAEAVESEDSSLPADCPWREVELPKGYRITPEGCVLQQGGGNGAPLVLARGPVWVEAFARDYRFDGWGSLLAWQDRDKQVHRAAFPAERFHESSLSLVQELASGGLAVVPGHGRALLQYLAGFDVRRRVRSVNRLGWVDAPDVPDPVYVFPWGAVGDAGDEDPVYQPEHRSVLTSAPQRSGDLDSWRKEVAKLAIGNPVLLFALSAGFAGPLLRFACIEGGGFHLHGSSSRGKTTAAQMSASVWGCGADPAEAPGAAFIRKWNTTANAVEAIAADHCDRLLVLDEIGESQAQDLGRLIYQLAGGQGKSRLTREAAPRAPRTWRVLMLSTGEVPVQTAIESAGRRAKGGQLVRMVDIPATGEDGDVIQDPHGSTPAEFVHRVKRACATHYGTAGRAFIRYLCRQGSIGDLSKMVQEDLAEAHRRLVPRRAAEEVSRVVRRFALVQVAGELACAARVLPFEPGDVSQAVRVVLERWLYVHGRGPMERAIEQLRAFILRNEARFREKDDTTHPVRELAGYKDQNNELYLLTAEGAREALEGHAVQDVMRCLLDRDLLFVNEEDRLLSGHRIRGIDRVVRLYAVKASLLGDKRGPQETRPEPAGHERPNDRRRTPSSTIDEGRAREQRKKELPWDGAAFDQHPRNDEAGYDR